MGGEKDRICNLRMGNELRIGKVNQNTYFYSRTSPPLFFLEMGETKCGVAKEKEMRMDGRNGVAPTKTLKNTCKDKNNPIQHLTYSAANTKQQNINKL